MNSILWTRGSQFAADTGNRPVGAELMQRGLSFADRVGLPLIFRSFTEAGVGIKRRWFKQFMKETGGVYTYGLGK